ncbi:type II toxin-antitoxin system prevent-host-death family antitoxin [bacterium]|nr:type II toxin-antitoxin system prevent-host-death family antitoxin [bacterium]
MKIGLREANLHFSKYIQHVREGNQVILTERGEPIAVIKPVKAGKGDMESRLRILEMQGLLRRGMTGPFRPPRAVRISGKALSNIVTDERDSRF